MLASIRFRRERLAAAAADEFLAATDIADLLVRRGVPFREAHGVVAGLVRTRDRQRQAAVGADRSRAARALAAARRGVLRGAARRRVARVQGVGGRHQPARGCASSSQRARATLGR